MEYVIGILLLITFIGLAVYAVRGGNLMMGMLIMGVLWTALPLLGNTFATNPDFIAAYPGVTDISFVDAITNVFQSGPEGWGSVMVNVVFGAWFGRVLLQTGIADALIRKAVELGGDKPVIICVLLSIVTTAIFSTLFGAGAVVAIGVIILPILMSLGIPKNLSIGSFMLSVGAGMYLNPVLTGQFLAFFLGDDGKQLITYDDPARLRWAGIGLAVQLLLVVIMCIVSLRKKKTVHAWCASAARKARPGYVPSIALIAPVLPVVLLVVFDIPIILGFTIGSFYALTVCGKLKSFRGPLTLFGCGAATLGILKGIGFSTPYLFALMVIPSITMNVSICMTQSWIAWVVSYAKVSTREHLKKTLPYEWIICIIMQAITYAMFG
ncbi:MAG TPA: citrate transporter [Candidatus Anaerobutyricum stercoris]|uniref:Citrate transporter n=1 Tax=Candidatus Anaerobutyricum stercoris TaxID=2838457 RepID=A0A9D2J7I3_9FIRM|nr:citrate transporter [Candidatus Anaerobutyricum stercoris]